MQKIKKNRLNIQKFCILTFKRAGEKFCDPRPGFEVKPITGSDVISLLLSIPFAEFINRDRTKNYQSQGIASYTLFNAVIV